MLNVKHLSNTDMYTVTSIPSSRGTLCEQAQSLLVTYYAKP